MSDPAARLAAVRPDVPVSLDHAVLVESWSNDTWVTERSVMDRLPGMDADLARRVRRRLDELQPLLSGRELTDGPVVHSDAHPANVLWRQGHLAALLDFEWARIGPPDLELEAVCRDDPYLAAHGGPGPCAAGDVPVLAGLRGGYPGCSSTST